MTSSSLSKCLFSFLSVMYFSYLSGSHKEYQGLRLIVVGDLFNFLSPLLLEEGAGINGRELLAFPSNLPMT